MRRAFIFLIGALVLVTFDTEAASQGKKKTPIWSDQKDAYGDPLPVGAIARIGTLRYRFSENRSLDEAKLSPDGKYLLVGGRQEALTVWELPAWTKYRTFNRKSIEKKQAVQFSGAAFTPDSKQIVAYDALNHRLLFFDLTANKLVRTLPSGEKSRYDGVRIFSAPDGQALVTVGTTDDGNNLFNEIQLWDLAKGTRIQKTRLNITGPGDRVQYAVSPAARRVARTISGEDPNKPNREPGFVIELHDLETGKLVHKLDAGQAVQHIAFSPDGKWLASSNGGAVLRIYAAAAGKVVHHIRTRRTQVTHLTFAPDSAHVYVGDMQGNVHRFSVANGELVASHAGPVREPIQELAFAPDGKIFALADGLESLAYWEVNTGKLLSPAGVPGGMITTVAFAPNGELFVTSMDGHASWWNPRTATKLRDLKLEVRDPVNDSEFRLYEFASLSPDLQFLVLSENGNYSVHDARTGKLLYDDDFNIAGQATPKFFDGGKKLIAVANNKVRIWNTRSGRDLASFTLPLREKEDVAKMAVTSNGKFIVVETFVDENAGRVLVWDMDAKKFVREWPQPERLERLDYSPDDRWLALASPREHIKLARVGSRSQHTLSLNNTEADITQIAFSPDLRQLAVAAIVPSRTNEDAGKIWIFELASKKVRLELVGHPTGIIDHLAFAPDSGLLASGAMDTTALIWQAGLRAFLPSPLGGEGPGVRGPAPGKEQPLPDADLQAAFTALSSPNAKTAFQHMIKLARTPQQTVALLDAKIAVAKRPDSGEKTVPQWIQDLSSSQFTIRTRANDMLKKLGPRAEPDLQAALQRANDVETRRRIEELLEYMSGHDWSQEEVQHARAVEVLDALATPAARAVLTRWAKGDPAAVLTQEAARALARVK